MAIIILITVTIIRSNIFWASTMSGTVQLHNIVLTHLIPVENVWGRLLTLPSFIDE